MTVGGKVTAVHEALLALDLLVQAEAWPEASEAAHRLMERVKGAKAAVLSRAAAERRKATSREQRLLAKIARTTQKREEERRRRQRADEAERRRAIEGGYGPPESYQ